MRHDAAIIDLRVTIEANFAILVIEDYSFIALLDIVLTTIIWASVHEGEFVSTAIIRRAFLRER